jgi:hypothetical protein
VVGYSRLPVTTKRINASYLVKWSKNLPVRKVGERIERNKVRIIEEKEDRKKGRGKVERALHDRGEGIDKKRITLINGSNG